MTLEQQISNKKIRIAKLVARNQEQRVKNESMIKRLQSELKSLEDQAANR